MADLGYDRVSGALVHNGDAAVHVHPFAPELRAIFDPESGPGSSSVFCIDRVPTVCLVDQAQLSANPDVRHKEMRDFCERL